MIDETLENRMSRILVLSAHDGRVDRRIIAEANALADSGRAVTLLSVPAELPADCLDARVQVIMPPVPHPVADRHGRLKSLLRGVSPRLYDLVRSRFYGMGRGPVEAVTPFFLKTAPPDRFDAIHCHDLPTLPAAIELSRQYGSAKVIYDSHELFPFQFSDKRIETYWLEVERTHIGLADLIIAVNESVGAEMQRLYGVATPTTVYNSYGIIGRADPLDRRQFNHHFGATGEAFTVLYQGNFVPDRNLENLVRAFASLDTNARLFLLGDGPLRTELGSIRDREGIHNVFFGAWVPQKDLLSFTACADLGVIPYLGGSCLNTRYCTPNKLFEYIEAGIPICASDLPELRKAVTRHGNGMVSAMETPQQIADAVAAARDLAQRGGFANACLEAARAYYTWQRQAEALLGAYTHLGV